MNQRSTLNSETVHFGMIGTYALTITRATIDLLLHIDDRSSREENKRIFHWIYFLVFFIIYTYLIPRSYK